MLEERIRGLELQSQSQERLIREQKRTGLAMSCIGEFFNFTPSYYIELFCKTTLL